MFYSTLLSRSVRSVAVLGFCGLFAAAGVVKASDATSPEMRMREQLRATMLQLRDAQTQLATLQATQADTDQKNKALTEQVQTLTKRLAVDKDASDKTIGDLKATLEKRDTKLAELNDSLEKWKIAQKQAVELATVKESQRAKLASDCISLQQHVDDQRTKNQAMFKLGMEVLTRYEKFGLGEALVAREPFTGIARVKFQTLVQDYQDKLADARIKPESNPAAPALTKDKPAANTKAESNSKAEPSQKAEQSKSAHGKTA